MAARTWLIISKPLRPPFRDGSTVLLRDLVRAMPEGRELRYLGDPAAPLRAMDRVIPAPAVGYSPRLGDKRRALAAILRYSGSPVHLCFTPGRATAAVIAGLRRVQPRRHFVQSLMSSHGVEGWVPLLRPLDRVVALSQGTADRLRAAGVEAERVVTIRPAVAAVVVDPPAVVAARRVMLYAGDLDPEIAGRLVGLGRALAAAPEWSLTIACRAKAERDAEARATLGRELAGELESGRVRLLAEVADMDALLRSAALQLFVATHTKHKVDLPLVLLEGLARGVPAAIVESPAAEIVALAAGAGVEAGVVAPPEPEPFAREVLELCRGARLESWSAGAASLAAREFSVGRMVGAYEALYAELDAAQEWERSGRERS